MADEEGEERENVDRDRSEEKAIESDLGRRSTTSTTHECVRVHSI